MSQINDAVMQQHTKTSIVVTREQTALPLAGWKHKHCFESKNIELVCLFRAGNKTTIFLKATVSLR